MEMFELRYFLAVAKTEHVGQAADAMNISSASLSKAVSRLEEELRAPLFYKTGRGIKLTPAGGILKKRATEILLLEEDTRVAFLARDAEIQVVISSDEILQTHFGPQIGATVLSMYPEARIQFKTCSDEQAIEQVRNGDAHLALTTSEVPSDLKSKTLAKVEFQTAAAKTHPLVKKYGNRHPVPVEELVSHPFVSPDHALLGRTSGSNSRDGWRDDKFPRKIKYSVGGLSLLERLVASGSALAFLPDYLISGDSIVPLKVSGCPYACRQTVRLLTRDSLHLDWLNKLWGRIF